MKISRNLTSNPIRKDVSFNEIGFLKPFILCVLKNYFRYSNWKLETHVYIQAQLKMNEK